MNSIKLTGRLTADPEMRTTHSATAVGDFRLAVQRRRSREDEDRGAVYVDVLTFGSLAESVGEYLEKGRQVAVSGRLELDEWETDAGERRSRHKVVADEVEFLARPPREAAAASAQRAPCREEGRTGLSAGRREGDARGKLHERRAPSAFSLSLACAGVSMKAP